MTAVFMAVFLLYMGEEEEDDSVALYGMGMMVMKRQRVEVEEEVAQARLASDLSESCLSPRFLRGT
jgi:hypothetical protein